VADLAAWPDVQGVLPLLLADLVADPDQQIVGARLPSDLQDHLPLIRVRPIGGSDDRFTDRTRTDVEVYGPIADDEYPAIRDLAEAIRQRLLAYPHITAAGNVDWVETELRPTEIPHDDPAVRLVAATYRISFRR
jgi:hypothetical protein